MADETLNNNHPVEVKDTSQAELIITDENEQPIITVANGHIRTANFDSANIQASSGGSSSESQGTTAIGEHDKRISDLPKVLYANLTGRELIPYALDGTNGTLRLSFLLDKLGFDDVLDDVQMEANDPSRPPSQRAVKSWTQIVTHIASRLFEAEGEIDRAKISIAEVQQQVVDSPHPIDVEDTTAADLIIADENRKVIATFANGHIRTANFDSANIQASSGGSSSDHPVAVENTTAADLIIADESRRAIATFAGGHIRTANFNSASVGAKEFAHFSIDDAVGIINLLKTSNTSSVWNIDFFNWLKRLHDRYGATISLYCQNSPSLSAVKDTWKAQLTEASSWLKFGFHNHTTGRAFSATAEQAKSYWEGMLEQVCRFACLDSFDRCPRLDYFEGSKDALVAMQGATYGALGYLAADDSRPSYFLSNDANTWLNGHHDAVIDSETGLTFFRTDYRIDWLKSGWSSANTPNWTPQSSNAYDDIEAMHNSAAYRDSFRTFVFFGHEVEILNNTNGQKWVEDACRWVSEHGLAWTYPQHLIYNVKSF